MKRKNSEKEWFAGLKWAESVYQQFADPRDAEWVVDVQTCGFDDPFDRGARDYSIYYERYIKPPEVPQLEAA